MKKRTAILATIFAIATVTFGCESMGKVSVSQVTNSAVTSTVSSNSEVTLSQEQQSESRNSTADVKQDYYAAINGDTLKEHDAEKTGGWSFFQEMEEQGFKNQKTILKELGDKIDTLDENSSDHQLAKLYLLGKDTASRDQDGTDYYKELLQPLMDTKDIQSFMTEAAKLQKNYGMKTFLNLDVYVSDANPSELTVALSDLNFGVDAEDLTAKDTQSENQYYFETYLAKLMELSGVDATSAKEKMGNVQSMLTDIAQNKKSEQQKEITVSELSGNFQHMDVQGYLKAMFQTQPDQILVSDTTYLKTMDRYFTEEHLDTLKAYVYAINLERLSPYLSTELQAAKQQMEKEYIGDGETTDPDDLVTSQVNEVLRWEMGKAYTQKYFDRDTEKAANDITNRLLQEYESIISEKDWLSDATKEKAIEKLKQIKIRIGAPENIDEYMNQTSVDRTKGYFYNIMQLKSEQSKDYYNAYGKTLDRNVWNVAPQELQPSYYPTDNSINIPAVTFQSPYFDKNASYETNLGSIGTTIAHEITHAFDDLGSQYDANGDMVNWWTDADRKEFDQRKQKIVDYYNNYKKADTNETDGAQTVGENIADLGAMKALSRIVKSDNLNGEEFFESYAKIWASTSNFMTDVLMSVVDEHASDKVRVNAVLSSTELFYETYDVKEGDGMYIAEDKRVELW